MALNAVLTADEERELQDGLHEIAAIEKSEQSLWQGGWSKGQQQQRQKPRQGDEDEYIQHARQRLNQVRLFLLCYASCCDFLRSQPLYFWLLLFAVDLVRRPLMQVPCNFINGHSHRRPRSCHGIESRTFV